MGFSGLLYGNHPGRSLQGGTGRGQCTNSLRRNQCEPGRHHPADPDGVIVIPRKDAAVILEEARKFQAADEAKLEASKNGTAKREWVDKALEAKGFEIIDDVYRHNQS